MEEFVSDDLTIQPIYRSTMERLEALRRETTSGVTYWYAREIGPILGYPTWREFGKVIDRAKVACVGVKLDPSKHFVLTHKMMELGGGAVREGDDYFLSRAACYLLAINGDPSKPEVAAAQAYFATQTRRMELEDSKTQDEKRLEARQKVTSAAKRVSGVAQSAGVRNKKQAVFHDARWQGLYGASAGQVKKAKGLKEKDNLFDFAGALELSANEFQMNLAADVIARERIRTEAVAIERNKQIGQHVRGVMQTAGSVMPEKLPLEKDSIAVVKKRLKSSKPRKAIVSKGRAKKTGPSSNA